MGRIEMDNQGAMVWVETSLRYARDRDLPRIVGLLAAVRYEIALEAEIAKYAPLSRWRT
ncbi:MAG: hypothetical protein JOZ19_09355 [Rubrobacter sp.]|nr:hypothetical protein [Rubrobacter sp.]